MSRYTSGSAGLFAETGMLPPAFQDQPSSYPRALPVPRALAARLAMLRLAVALVTLLGGAAGDPAEMPASVYAENKMCQGPFLYTRSYVNMGLDTVRECTKKCFELDGCEFFTYDPRDVYCYFNAKTVGCELKDPRNSGATVYRIQRPAEEEVIRRDSDEVATISWYNPKTCETYPCQSVGDDLGVWSRGCLMAAEHVCQPKCDESSNPLQCTPACTDWCDSATKTCNSACAMGFNEVAGISWYNSCEEYACETVDDLLAVWYQGCLLAAEYVCKPKCEGVTDKTACLQACPGWCDNGITACRKACLAMPVSPLERAILP